MKSLDNQAVVIRESGAAEEARTLEKDSLRSWRTPRGRAAHRAPSRRSPLPLTRPRPPAPLRPLRPLRPPPPPAVKTHVKDSDEFKAFGGIDALTSKVEKTGAKVQSKLTSKVTHILASHEFLTAEVTKGETAGQLKNREWISKAESEHPDAVFVDEKQLKKMLA